MIDEIAGVCVDNLYQETVYFEKHEIIDSLIDKGKFNELEEAVEDIIDLLESKPFLIHYNYVGLLLDAINYILPEKGSIPQKTIDTVEYFFNYVENKDEIDKKHIHYSKAALILIKTQCEPPLDTIDKIKKKYVPVLNEYREILFLDQTDEKSYTNIANYLLTLNRLTESIYCFDQALKSNPNLWEALYGKIRVFIKLQANYSMNPDFNSEKIAMEIEELRIKIIKIKNAPEFLNEKLKQELSVPQHSRLDYLKESRYIQDEAIDKTIEELFYMEHGLFLSEHSMYCKCSDGYRDDIFLIPSNTQLITKINWNTFLKEEHLEILKAQYIIARSLFYWFYQGECKTYSGRSFNNPQTQKVDYFPDIICTQYYSISIRTCFSILDKIMNYLFILHDIKFKKEDIKFTTSWKYLLHELQMKNPALLDNEYLLALYSMGCELQEGTLKTLKSDRNILEHQLGSVDNTRGLYFFQLIKSAIISFVYCFRTLNLNEGGNFKSLN